MSGYTVAPATADATEEWFFGVPRSGFRALQVMSIIVITLCVPTLGLQGFVMATMDSSGNYGWGTTSAAVWAAIVACIAATYVLIFSWAALSGRQGMRVHLIIGTIVLALSSIVVISGMSISAVTSGNIALISGDDTQDCYYFNSSYPVDAPWTTTCVDCNPTYSWGDNVAHRSCCCCAENFYGTYDSMTFYGVDSCNVVFDKILPAATASAVAYGISALLAFVMSICGCVMACGCCRGCRHPYGPMATTTYINASPAPQSAYTAIPVAASSTGAAPTYGATAPQPAYNPGYGTANPPAYSVSKK